MAAFKLHIRKSQFVRKTGIKYRNSGTVVRRETGNVKFKLAALILFVYKTGMKLQRLNLRFRRPAIQWE